MREYVNLYFQAWNAMLYRLICNMTREELVVLQISPSILKRKGTWFSDRNAAAFNVRFYSGVDDLGNIDGSVFKKEYWTDGDDTKQKRLIMQMYAPYEAIPTLPSHAW